MSNIKLKYNKRTIIILLIILFFICLLFSAGIIYKLNMDGDDLNLINQKKKEEVKELINFDSLPQDFIDNYLDEVGNLSKEEKDNLLIVISENKLENTYGASKVIEAPNNQYYLIYDNVDKKNHAFEKMNSSSDVVSIEENIYLPIEEGEVFWGMDAEPENSNSQFGYNSWGVEKLGFDDAIGMTDDIRKKEPERIKDVVVGLIDSGLNIDVFNERYSGKLYDTYDAVDPNAEMTDSSGHGTHIAGTIAEITPSNVKLLAIKASDHDRNVSGDENGFYYLDIITSINYALSKNVDVISLSTGAHGENYSFYQSIEACKEKNIIVVTSAGNNDTDEYHYPSDYDNTISVAAVDYGLEKTIFSNYGNGITFSAPGFYIKSLSHVSGFMTKSGTSMSTPHVAGAVAILKSFNKDLSLENSIALLKKYSIDIGDDGWDQFYGYGVVNFNDVSFCNENVICDEYGVFEKNDFDSLTTIRIEATDKFITEYNYGSNTNIVNAKINLYYNDNDYYTKTLSQLIDKIKIINYEPNSYTEQVVTIKYGDFETLLYVDNRQMVDGWLYNDLGSDEIQLSSLDYKNIDYNDGDFYTVTDYPQVIYIPSKINGKDVVSLGENSFFKTILSNKTRLKRVYIPYGVREIGKNAFMVENNKYVKYAGNLELTIPESVESIDSTAFMNRDKLFFYVVKDSYAHNYAINNDINYLCLDEINIAFFKEDIRAFDKVNPEDLSINVVYTGTVDSVSETIDNYEITYYNGNDSFRYGDSGFDVSFDTSFGHHIELGVVFRDTVLRKEVNKPTIVDKQYIYNGEEQQIELDGFDENIMSIVNNYRTNAGEQEVIVSLKDSNYMWNDRTTNQLKFVFKIDKALPEYIIPTGLQAKINQKLEDISLPENFEWMDGEQSILEVGEKKYMARYVPSDNANFKSVDNIEVSINVLKNILTPNIMIKDKIYDNSSSINLDDVIISNLENIDYTIESIELISSDVGRTKVKVRLKLSDDIYSNYEFENGMQEQTFDVDIDIRPCKIKKVTSINKKYVYNGKAQKFELDGFDEDTMIITNNYRTNVGEQEVTVSLRSSNYMWEDGTNNVLKFTFKIEKAPLDIEYKSLDNNVVFDGNKHGIILNISDSRDIKIRYMDNFGKYTLDDMPMYMNAGTYIIKYKLYIDDNYTEVFGEQTLKINKFVITNTSSDYETIYDGKEHSISIKLNTDSYDIKYSINNTNYDLREKPTFKDVGEYTINYKISCDNCEDLIGSNKVKIYGIKEYADDLIIRNNVLVIKNNSFKSVKDKISVYSKSVIYNHLDKNKLLVNSDVSKTGDILSININNLKTFEYYLSIIGDVNSDGKISSADYVKIKKHIMETEIIKDKVYVYSADINSDNRISSEDYIKVKKYIMNGEKF